LSGEGKTGCVFYFSSAHSQTTFSLDLTDQSHQERTDSETCSPLKFINTRTCRPHWWCHYAFMQSVH